MTRSTEYDDYDDKCSPDDAMDMIESNNTWVERVNSARVRNDRQPASPPLPNHASRELQSPRRSPHREEVFRATLNNEREFREEMFRVRRLRIVDQAPDGNCLFRSVSHQVYGTEDHHLIVRSKCLDYIQTQAYFFEAFVDGAFTAYVAQLRRDGVWGGDLEIQAMAEIYNRPIEIYAYQLTPKRIYAAHVRNDPIRLSYHFRSHYNSVVDQATFGKAFLRGRPGVPEEAFIRRASGLGRRLDPNDLLSVSDREATDTETLRHALEQSRQEFHSSNTSEFDRVVKESLDEFEARMLKDGVAESEREEYDRQIVEQMVQTTKQSPKTHWELSQEDKVLQKVLAHSRQGFADADFVEDFVLSEKQHTQDLPVPVRMCVSQGFPLEKVVEAYSVCAGAGLADPLVAALMTDYILSSF